MPSGWLGDVFGPRRTLIRIVLWWSFFTALTGLIWPVAGMVPQYAMYLDWSNAIRQKLNQAEYGDAEWQPKVR